MRFFGLLLHVLITHSLMYILLTKFQVNPIFEKPFRVAWNHSCKLLQSKGMIDQANLFKVDPVTFITETRWINGYDFKEVLDHPDEILKPAFDQLKEHSNKIVFLHRMHLLESIH
jgi:hypothetical protein